MNRKSCISATLAILALCQMAIAQNWTNSDYQKALWMTTRFYGGQRSGDNNWLLYNHLPAGVDPSLRGRAFRADYNTTDGVDLSGGWHDCGDHVKFGQTQFYSAYLLLKGYAEFPGGYDDRYSFDYDGYKSSGQWNFEGSGHDPNCIPDVLDEMKHETDYLIKCTPDGSTFWWQVGHGGSGADHAYWETAVKSQTRNSPTGNGDNGTPGTRRPSCKNPNDGSMASFAGATLALMARVYQPYDAAYASLCLTHAVNAYNYAKTRTSNMISNTCFGGFYTSSFRDTRDAYVCLLAELYLTTGNVAYQTEANGHQAGVNWNGGWSFDYVNTGELGLYCLAQIGNATAHTRFNTRITGHYLAAGSRNANGVYTAYGTWGRLRYNGNAAFLISLYSKLNSDVSAPVINAIHNDIDYIMGKNSNKRTYIVGFEPAAGGPFIRPLKPHHRNVYLRDDNPANTDNSLTIPAKNTQHGALVGGQRDGTYNDDRNDYENTEVCIDYNAGLVGALGFINERLAPVTISCGGNACWQPNLGPNISTCSSTLPVVLNANAGAPGGDISYRWYTWNGTIKTVIGGATGQTYSANAVGAYIVERDSAYVGGPCTKRDTIWITNTITKPNLGADPAALCTPSFVDLTPSNTADFPGGTTWQWSKASALAGPYSNITGATSSTLSNVRIAGYYRVVATAGSCTNADTINTTSNQPTPVDGCRSGTGTVNLAITDPGLNGTNYNWYDAASGGNLMAGGTATTTFITPSISSTTTYYVQDMSAVNTTVGEPSAPCAGSTYDENRVMMRFDAYSNFTLVSIKLMVHNYSGPQTINNVIVHVHSAATYGSNILQSSAPYSFNHTGNNSAIEVTVPVNLTITGASPTPTTYWLSIDLPNTAFRFFNGCGSSYQYLDNSASPGSFVRIHSHRADGGFNAGDYGPFYNWVISTGSSCDRLPVIATVGTCSGLPVELVNFYATNSSDHVNLSWSTAKEENNDRFEIERSVDGVNFTVIASISGNGTKSSLSTYSYTDFDPIAGTSYYRLAQYDLDGTATYSHIEAVDRENRSHVSVVPNPFSNSADLIVSSSVNSRVTIRISDLSGKILWFSDEYSTNEVISVGANLPKGVYIIHAGHNDSVYTSRMVKQ